MDYQQYLSLWQTLLFFFSALFRISFITPLPFFSPYFPYFPRLIKSILTRLANDAN